MLNTQKLILICFLICLIAVTQTDANHHLRLSLQHKPNQEKIAFDPQIFANLTLKLNKISSGLKNFGNSTQCSAKISQLSAGIESGNLESIAFLDALGKPGPGVTTGNFLWLGNYDMCGVGALGNQTSGYMYKNCVVMATLKLGSFPLSLT